MAEPIYQIATEVSEEDFCRALKVSCPKNRTIELFLLALVECFFAFYFWFDDSPRMLTILIGMVLFILGIVTLVRAIQLPGKLVKVNVQGRRVMSGKSDVREELEFLEEEILSHNMDIKKDYHIPYSYIERIYIFEDMLVYTVDQSMGQIMKRGIPNETEFISWFISKCSNAKVKTVS